MKPSQKSKAINDLLSLAAGRDREKTIEGNICMLCGGEANIFKDRLSEKEYSISGACQECQDSIWK